jgi:hypothetical protein
LGIARATRVSGRRYDRRFSPSLLGLFAILAGALHLAAVFHFAIVAHEVCVEHGELTHRAEASAGVRRQLSDASAVRPGAAQPLHDHCLPNVARERHALLPDTSWSEVIVAGQSASPALSFEATSSRVQCDVLRVAPKQSPPHFCA